MQPQSTRGERQHHFDRRAAPCAVAGFEDAAKNSNQLFAPIFVRSKVQLLRTGCPQKTCLNGGIIEAREILGSDECLLEPIAADNFR